MSRETLSTARTSPLAPPPKADSPSGKTLVRLRISSSGTSIPYSRIKNISLSTCYQRHRRQRRDHAHGLPSGEVFFQDDAREHDGDHGIEGSQDHSGVQATGLTGEDEEDGASDVEAAGEDSDPKAGPVERFQIFPGDHNARGHRQRSGAGSGGEPERGATARLPHADEEDGKPNPRQQSQAQTFGGTGAFGAGNEPDPDEGEGEPGNRQRARETLCPNAEEGGDGGADHGGHGGGESHVVGEGTIEKRQRDAAGGASGQRPLHTVSREQRHVIGRGDGDDQGEAAGVADHGEEEGVEALGGVSAEEVANAPAHHGAEGVEGGGEVWGDGHGLVSRVAERPHLSQRTRSSLEASCRA